MSRKSFEAGMAAGVKPVGEKLDQLGQRIENVHSEQEKVKEKISILSDDLETRDKLRQLGLENYHDLTELEESEKVILMSLLYWLAQHKAPSDSQRKYLSCLGRYIGAFGIGEGISPVDTLQNISDTDVHKVFLKAVLEYIYLNTQSWTFDENEQNMIGAFEIGLRTLESIKRGVEGEFQILGGEGLAQKYDIREVPKEDGQVQPTPVEETELEKNIETDMNMTDNEETAHPFHQLINIIRNYTVTGAFGELLLGGKENTDKSKLIIKVLPTVLPVSKTVVEITKTAIGHLVFTTHALYWVVDEKYRVKDKEFEKIPYAGIQADYLGTKLIENVTAFVYAPPGEEQVNILGLDAEALEKLLFEISALGEYAESDVLTEFPALPQEVQLTYMQLLASIIRENGNPLHEVYRLAVQYGLNEHWDRICAELGFPFEDAFRDYMEQVPYPNEEALAISLLRDICTVYQYTKDSDVLTVPEKKYFPIIFNGSTEDRDAIIQYAQMEKKVIEQRIDAKSAQAVTDAFSVAAGAVGASVLAYSGAMALFWSTLWFNFIPGIGTLISAAVVGGSVVSGFLSSQNKKKLSEVETRQKMRDELMHSYRKAEETAAEQGFAELLGSLHEEALKIADRIGFRYAEYTGAEQALLKRIHQEIITFMKEDQKTCSEKKLISHAKLVEDLPSKEWDRVLSNLTFSSSDVGCDDVIGLYDPTFSGAVFGNFMGILFLRDGICFRKNKSTPIQQMSYFDMVAMDEKLTSVIVCGKNGDKITLNAINYSKIVGLLRKIVKIARERV